MHQAPLFVRISLNAIKGGLTRFETLKRYLGFNDNSKQPELSSPEYDKLYKIKPVLDSVLNKCRNVESEQYIAEDEQIIPTKIKNVTKQCLPKKPHKRKFKVFSRCGSFEIIYEFEIYPERTSNASTELEITDNLVMRLCSNLSKNQNYKV